MHNINKLSQDITVNSWRGRWTANYFSLSWKCMEQGQLRQRREMDNRGLFMKVLDNLAQVWHFTWMKCIRLMLSQGYYHVSGLLWVRQIQGVMLGISPKALILSCSWEDVCKGFEVRKLIKRTGGGYASWKLWENEPHHIIGQFWIIHTFSVN